MRQHLARDRDAFVQIKEWFLRPAVRHSDDQLGKEPRGPSDEVFVAAPGTMTLPVRMFLYIQDNIDPLVTSVSACLIAMTGVVMILLDRLYGLDRLFLGGGKA